MWRVCILVFVIAVTGGSQGLSETTTENVALGNNETIPCIFVPGLYLGSRIRELDCCNETVKLYELNWVMKRAYLTRYLRTLKDWKCPQFAEECNRRTFAYNSFGSNVYDHFCNHEQLVSNCYEKVSAAVERRANSGSQRSNAVNSNANSKEDNWMLLTNRLKKIKFTVDDLKDTCLQVALYETGDKTKYQEIKSAEIPTCGLFWGGFDADSLERETISPWTISNLWCKLNLVIIDVVCAILGLMTIVVNITVIGVFFANREIRHSQGIYKISLAVADLLVGIIVFPTFIVSLWMATHTPLKPYDSELPSYINGTPSTEEFAQLLSAVPYHKVLRYSESYLNFVGFFTISSLTVSIFTLTAAGSDRLMAVRKPLSYRKDKARRLAIRLSLLVWFVAITFAVSAIFVPSLSYVLIASFFTSLAGREANILYAVLIYIPLFVMWGVCIATYIYARQYGKIRRNITQASSTGKNRSIENRLARTLVLMVGAFTMSVLSALVMLLTTSFISTTHTSQPRVFEPDVMKIVVSVNFVSFLLLACNSLWNFFIYNGRNVDFRKAVRKIIKELAKKSGFLRCSDTIGLCCRRVAYHGQRRLSSFPTITGLTGDHKDSSSSEPTTAMSQAFSSGKLDSNGENSVFSSGAKSSIMAPKTICSNTRGTDLLSEDKKRKKKGREVELARDTSIFRSFVIDAHADHLVESVMDNIDEEVFSPTAEKNITVSV